MKNGINTIDYHTEGQPLRIAAGIRDVPGDTMAERRAHAAHSLRDLKDFLLNEPRGHAEMFGAFLTAPVNEGSAFGVLFFDAGGFKASCGHGAIALAAAAVEQGWIPAREGKNTLFFDVPNNTVKLEVVVEGGLVSEVIYRHVTSMMVRQDVLLTCTRGRLSADIVSAGAGVALIDARQLDLSLDAATLPQLRDIYADLRRSDVFAGLVHPVSGDPFTVDLVLFVADRGGGENHVDYDVAALFSDGSLDRSPCGTGTSARLTQLHHRGRLTEGGTVRATSLIGSTLAGRVLAATVVSGNPAIVPEIVGHAYMTGRHEFVLDQNDPFATGFRLR